jgi:hypothetical protein
MLTKILFFALLALAQGHSKLRPESVNIALGSEARPGYLEKEVRYGLEETTTKKGIPKPKSPPPKEPPCECKGCTAWMNVKPTCQDCCRRR